MSAREMQDSQPAPGEAIDGRDARQQPAPLPHDVGSDETHRDESGASATGSYREQDYGGEPTHPPIDPQAS